MLSPTQQGRQSSPSRSQESGVTNPRSHPELYGLRRWLLLEDRCVVDWAARNAGRTNDNLDPDSGQAPGGGLRGAPQPFSGEVPAAR